MTLFTTRNIRMAIQSIKSTRTRSFLTMIGIIIGVASVITAVSLGEGIRRQVAGNLQVAESEIITIRPGKLVNRAEDGSIRSVNYGAALSSDTLSDQDVQSIAKLPSVQSSTPLSTISGLMSNKEDRQFDGTVIGTGPEFAAVSGQKIAYGEFFDDTQTNKEIAIVGKAVAEQLFQENVPIGQTIIIRNHEFIVSGVFDSFTASALSNASDLNRAVFIPYNQAKAISSNSAHIYQILVEPKSDAKETVKELSQTLKDNHGGQEDFAILNQEETLQLTGRTLTNLTSFIAGIAAISLIVGGIGIMNIMFVSVTERTREIGVRKSLGATNKQIYGQFLVEATLIGFAGGIIGVLLAFLCNFLFVVFTNLRPVATLPIVASAIVVSSAVGIIFGTVPAIKAARKDPIESLRYE